MNSCCISTAKAKKVYLVYKNLNSIRVSSSGDVRGENTLETENLSIDPSSAWSIFYKGEVEAVDTKSSSAGSVVRK